MSETRDLFAKLADEGPVGADKLFKEDEILNEEEKKKPEASCGPLSGETKQKFKKPCANCTCGLADEIEKEAKVRLTESASNGAEKSSCGSCYLGDAFRCASCPYRGMPAFKPGEKVTIDTTTDDI